MSKTIDYSKCCYDFSLIFILFFFLSYPNHMSKLAHSILGRLFAVLLLVFYTSHSIIYGLLFCVILLFYYQYIPTFRLDKTEGFFWELYEENGKIPDSLSKYIPFEENPLIQKRSKDDLDFIGKYCPLGDLNYKGFQIQPEMAQHVFSELKQTETCNPCNPMCKFSIIESRLKTENELVTPKNSNNWYDIIMMRTTQ